MVYLDSDVLINFLVEQNPQKHKQADGLFSSIARKDALFMSFLVLQEIAFVLGKLNVPAREIAIKLNELLLLNPYTYGSDEYRRAIFLAQKIGFYNFNDCLHTAIAETHCAELITYNKSDFVKIQPLTSLKISILWLYSQKQMVQLDFTPHPYKPQIR